MRTFFSGLRTRTIGNPWYFAVRLPPLGTRDAVIVDEQFLAVLMHLEVVVDHDEVGGLRPAAEDVLTGLEPEGLGELEGVVALCRLARARQDVRPAGNAAGFRVSAGTGAASSAPTAARTTPAVNTRRIVRPPHKSASPTRGDPRPRLAQPSVKCSRLLAQRNVVKIEL